MAMRRSFLYIVLATSISIAILAVAARVCKIPPGNAEVVTLPLWSFKQGERIRIHWSILESVSSFDVIGRKFPTEREVDIVGVVEVGEIQESGGCSATFLAERWLVLETREGAGRMDILVENGKVIRPPAPHSSGFMNKVALILAPAKIRITATGGIFVDEAHPLHTSVGGEGFWLGPVLPENSVTLGTGWKMRVRSAGFGITEGPEISVGPIFRSVVQVSGRKFGRVEVGETGMANYEGMSATFIVKATSFFDIERRMCTRSVFSSDFECAGESGGEKVKLAGFSSLFFEVLD